MQSLEIINRKIHAAEGLHSIVKTMKIIAAVNIRQFEKMLKTLEEYNRTVEMGLQVVLKTYKMGRERENDPESLRTGVVIFGSDMGLCGQFNEQIASFTEEKLQGLQNTAVIAVGEKITAKLEDSGIKPDRVITYPARLAGGAAPVLQEILFNIENWYDENRVQSVILFYNKPAKEGFSYFQQSNRMLPVDQGYLDEIREREWKSRSLPVFKMKRDDLFAALIRNHFYIKLYRAFIDSLTSENTARLVSMQSADKHINEHLEDLTLEFNQERQDIITGELLDIMAGVEALKLRKPV